MGGSCSPDKGSLSEKYKELKKLNIKLINNPVNNWVNELNSSQKKKLSKIHEEECKIFYNKGNGNQNNTEMSCHPSQNDCHQENRQQGMMVRMDRTLTHSWWECKLVQPLLESV
jgi:hypothetical protein